MDERKLKELSRKLIEDAEDPTSSGSTNIPDRMTNHNNMSRAYIARDNAQKLLAAQVLKNTGVPIPHKTASVSKFEDFLNRIMKERYPELEPDVNLEDLTKDEANGLYWRGVKEKPWIEIDRPLKKDPVGAVGTMLHEAGHQYDDKVLKTPRGKETMDELVSMLGDKNPAQIYEQIAKGHHAEIPNLREGSFGKGALKSLLKSGNFRAIAPLLAGAAGGAISLGAEAADSELEGSAPEEMQMQRESDQAKFEAAINKLNPGASEQLSAIPPVKAQDLLKEEEDKGPKFRSLSRLLNR